LEELKAIYRNDALLLKTLIPHLQRAVQLHQRITGLQKERNLALDALNRWPLGVILVNAKGQVLLANRAAEAILKKKDGLFFDRGALRAARPAETATLRKLILGAIQPGGRNGMQPGGALVLPRPSLKRSLKILVTPACANASLFVEPAAAAAVFVSDPESVTEPNTDCLTRLYDLTPAESMLALLLMQGKSTEETAEELCVTKNAVRFHLKHIFEKTGTRRQGELVRLLLTGPAQLRIP
jgi:DNA-binding CsgD family transcriptional regulator